MMIRAHGLWKSFGSQVLLRDVSFAVNAHEKVGLIGRNGHGKSTLLKMIQGLTWPDRGEVHIRDGQLLEAVDQHITFQCETVRAEACLGLREMDLGQDWLAAKILYGLGFTEADQHLHPRSFSGGFQVRINLARALLSKPDIMLLDEPTNFLDITSLRWLEGFLQQWKGTFMLVTHDRTFMEAVVTHTMAIHRAQITKVPGGPQKLKSHLEVSETIHEKTRLNQEKKDQKTKEFIKNFRAGARSAGLVQSRIKMLAKKSKLPKLPPIRPIRFQFLSDDFPADSVIRASSLRFAYEPTSPELLHGFDLTIKPHDRIAIVGPNGRGKSTLLQLLTGQLQPDSGTVKTNKDAQVGYFRQMHHALEGAERTVFEALRAASATHTDQDIHKLCGHLMFEGDKRYKPLKVLSGGERSRLALGRLMLRPYHLLALDEPTNHLDMESCDALGTALQDYDGAVICVTHDEALLRSFAQSLIVFDDGHITHFRGTYDHFLKTKGWTDPESGQLTPATPTPTTTPKVDYAQAKARKRHLRPHERAITTQEKIVEKLEAEEADLNEQIAEAQRKGQVLKIGDLSIAIADKARQIESAFAELENLHAQLESATQQFAAQWAESEND